MIFDGFDVWMFGCFEGHVFGLMDYLAATRLFH